MSRTSEQAAPETVTGAVALETGDRAQMCADVAFPGLHTMSASFINHCFAPHTHDEVMIGTIEKGVQSFLRDRKTHFAPPLSMSIINPGDVHTGETANHERLVYRAIYIPVGVLQRAQIALRLPAQLLGFPEAVTRDSRLWLALERYHNALEAKDFTIVRESHLYAALQILLGEHTGELNADRVNLRGWQEARKVLEMLHSLREGSPTLQHLADTVGLSTFQTIRAFRNAFGVTPHAYLLLLKIQRAKELLRIGTPICDVAAEVGFVDQSHLHRHFRRMTGVSPAIYQKTLRSTIRNEHERVSA
jgi:AraC-like DNA-binding protein